MWAQQTTQPTQSLAMAPVMLITGDPPAVHLACWLSSQRWFGVNKTYPGVKQWNSFEKPQT